MNILHEAIGANATFFYSGEMELLFAAAGLLTGENPHAPSGQNHAHRKALQEAFPFLFEMFSAQSGLTPLGILEPLLCYPLEGFTLAGYKAYLLSLDKAAFLSQYFDGLLTEAEAETALTDDEALRHLFTREPRPFTSLIAMTAFYRDTARILSDFFALAEALRTPAFVKALGSQEAFIASALMETKAALAAKDPLSHSQALMDKTFRNRGPFDHFVFAPSFYLPARAIRFMGKRQILFYALSPAPYTDAHMIAQLKAIADPSRFAILSLLGQKAPMRGGEIAKALGLAPSTISHHMEQLREAGLLHEEPAGNARYYSLNRPGSRALLERLNKALNDSE